MTNKISSKNKPDAKTIVKTGFRRSLGLAILFATVTLTSCTELLSPFFNLFK